MRVSRKTQRGGKLYVTGMYDMKYNYPTGKTGWFGNTKATLQKEIDKVQAIIDNIYYALSQSIRSQMGTVDSLPPPIDASGNPIQMVKRVATYTGLQKGDPSIIPEIDETMQRYSNLGKILKIYKELNQKKNLRNNQTMLKQQLDSRILDNPERGAFEIGSLGDIKERKQLYLDSIMSSSSHMTFPNNASEALDQFDNKINDLNELKEFKRLLLERQQKAQKGGTRRRKNIKAKRSRKN